MKKLIGITMITLFLGTATVASAQETKQEVKKTARKVGNKTASIASKGKSRITDQRLKDKQGPNGETVYVDNHSRYYWVDNKGKRHYVNSAQLQAKND